MKKGFTLIEMLVAMTITLIILGVTTAQFFMQKRHLNIQEVQVKLDRDTRLSLMAIGNEIREVGLDPHKTHAFGFTSADSHFVTYSIDRDEDGIVDAADAGDVHLVGNDLIFNGSTILSDVTGLTFTYYDNAGNPIPTPPPINEDDGTGFFTPVVSKVEILLTTQITDPQGRILGISNQTAQFERKNW